DDVPVREVSEREDTLDLVGSHHLSGALFLSVVPEYELPLHVSADALQRRSCQHPFGRATDAEQEVDTRLLLACGDGRVDVAVLDELDTRAGLPNFADDVLVSRAIEDDHGEVGDIDAPRLGQRGEVLGWRLADV